jgi:hypothetical protein
VENPDYASKVAVVSAHYKGVMGRSPTGALKAAIEELQFSDEIADPQHPTKSLRG